MVEGVITEGSDEARLIADICRADFEEFVREFWNEVPGAGTMVWNWHMSLLCNELQTVAERVFKWLPKEYDEVFNVSPGTSKSTLASIMFPAWVWTRMPHARVISASHTMNLVLDLANKARQVIKSDKYRACFPEIEIRSDQDTKGYYANTKGGDRHTSTVAGQSPTGFHGHFLICDDLLDPKKAVSDTELKNAEEFITTILTSRKVDKAVSVMFLIQQRLHANDTTAVMLEGAKRQGASPVRHICLPAELPKGTDGVYLPANVSPPELVSQYIDGLMDPVRLSRKMLDEYRSHGTYSFAGQFLQNPVPLGGSMFKEDWFKRRVPVGPYIAKRVRYIDKASTQDGGCYTASVVMSKTEDNRWYVERLDMGQWEPDVRDDKFVEWAVRDRNRYGEQYEPIIYIEQEPGSSGVDSFKHSARRLAGFRVRPHRPTGMKEVRAEPWSSQLGAGNVWIVDDGTWDIDTFVRHHLLFPKGPKDLIDACSGAFNRLINDVRVTGTLRILPLSHRGRDKGRRLRVVVCNREQLDMLSIDEPYVLVVSVDPRPDAEAPEIPDSPKLLRSVTLPFADIDPAEVQDRWNDPVAGYGRTPDQLVMTKDIGKRLWAVLLRKDGAGSPSAIVVCDDGDRRANSLACAICDCLRLPREAVERVDSRVIDLVKQEGVNRWVLDMAKQSREMVM